MSFLRHSPHRSGLRTSLLLTLALASAPCLPISAQLTNGVGLKVLGAPPPDPPPIAGQPLETRPPNGTGQRPAFRDQTRAPAVITRTPYTAGVITRGLHKPWGMTFLPGGKILITEKPGTMRLVDMKTGSIGPQVLGVPKVLFVGDAGLLDVTADPNFATNRRIYFTYVQPRGPLYKDPQLPLPQQDNGVVIARARLSRDNTRLENLTTLLRVEPSIPQTAHYGSRLLFDRQGFLFVSLGERFFYPTRGEAQSLFSYMGKVLRIDTDGHPAPGNPFDEGKNFENFTLPEIWSIGHRNPEGLAINPATGELWDSEHGPQGGDEINLVQRGKNYGWPLISYGANYDGTRIDGTLAKQDGVWTSAAGKPAPAPRRPHRHARHGTTRLLLGPRHRTQRHHLLRRQTHPRVERQSLRSRTSRPAHSPPRPPKQQGHRRRTPLTRRRPPHARNTGRPRRRTLDHHRRRPRQTNPHSPKVKPPFQAKRLAGSVRNNSGISTGETAG